MTYHYTVFWSEEGREYVGLCYEFPLLSWLEPDKFAAFVGIVFLVADILEDMQSTGEKPPDPAAGLTIAVGERQYLPVKTPPISWPDWEVSGAMPFGIDALYYQDKRAAALSPVPAD